MPPSACAAVIDQYRRGRLSPMIARRIPRLNPSAASPHASARTSSATCDQVHVRQMPRSFSRVAGRSPRTSACSSNKRGKVASSASISSSPTRRQAIDHVRRAARLWYVFCQMATTTLGAGAKLILLDPALVHAAQRKAPAHTTLAAAQATVLLYWALMPAALITFA